MQKRLNHGTETETLGYGGPAEVVIDEWGDMVRLLIRRRSGSRRNVFVGSGEARRLANAVDADADDRETLATETAANGDDVVVRHRGGRRELTLPRRFSLGRQLIQLDPFEAEVAEGLRDAAAVVDDPDSAKPVATDGGEPA